MMSRTGAKRWTAAMAGIAVVALMLVGRATGVSTTEVRKADQRVTSYRPLSQVDTPYVHLEPLRRLAGQRVPVSVTSGVRVRRGPVVAVTKLSPPKTGRLHKPPRGPIVIPPESGDSTVPPVPGDPETPVEPEPIEPPGVVAAVACVSGDMTDLVTFEEPLTGGQIHGYVLMRMDSPEATPSVVAATSPDSREFAVRVSVPGVSYYTVAATGPGGTGEASTPVDNRRVLMTAEVPVQGATLASSNGEVRLTLAADSYAETTTVTIAEVDGTAVDRYMPLSGLYDITPSGPLGSAATLWLSYGITVDQPQIAAAMMRAARVATYDETAGAWITVEGSGLVGDWVQAQLTHFSYYTPVAPNPHGKTGEALAYCSSGGEADEPLCHSLAVDTNSAIRLQARDPQVCYYCHGNVAGQPNAFAVPSTANIEEAFHVYGGPGSMSAHPVGVDEGFWCTSCHDPHQDPATSPGILKSYDAASGQVVREGDEFCWTCHGTTRNRRVNYEIQLAHPESPGYNYWRESGGDQKTGYDAGDLATATGETGITCTACHEGHGSDAGALLVDSIGPFTPEGIPRHAGADHAVQGPCVSSGCHGSDAAVIHAGPGCDACHAAGTTASFACRSCHAGDQHPTADHINDAATQCLACHAETNLMSVHADDCGRCHATGADLTYSGGCSQSGCHSTTHVDAWEDQEYWVGHSAFGVAHGNYGADCWSCHEGNGEIYLGAACTTPYCHPDVYERIASTTTSNAVAAYTGPTVISLTPTDAGASGIISGVRETYYRLNGGPLEKGVSVLVLPPTSGTAHYTLEFWSMDANLNTEPPRFASFTVSAGGMPDSSPPAGMMSVNSGATYASSWTVSVNSSVADPDSGVSMMRVDPGTGQWGGWMPYAASKAVTISGDGLKTIRAEYRNGWGVSTVLSDTITLDTDGPTGSIGINGGAAWTTDVAVTLDLSAVDAGSGVASMRFSNNGSSWSAWEAYQPTKPWSLTATNGTKTVYVQYRDNLGNVGPVISDTISYFVGTDTTPPTGSVQVSGGAPYTTTLNVTLTLSATDPETGVAEMRLSNDNANWTAWEPFATTKAWTLSSGYGNKYVYVQYRNGQGVQSTSKQDWIVYDPVAPTGTVIINDTGGTTDTRAVVLSLYITDTGGSGYREGAVRFSNDGASWTAWEEWIQWQGDQSRMSKLWALTAGDGIKTVYVQYRDRAGNVSTVVTDTTTATWVASNKATLAFRWLSGDEGWADLHVENSVGVTIAETEVTGSGDQLTWLVAVPAGQDYRMVCDAWEYYDGGDNVPYGIWSSDTSVNPDGILSVGEVVIWNY